MGRGQILVPQLYLCTLFSTPSATVLGGAAYAPYVIVTDISSYPSCYPMDMWVHKSIMSMETYKI